MATLTKRKLRALVDRDRKRPPPERKDDYDPAKLERIVQEEGDRINDGRGDRNLAEFIRKNYDSKHNPASWVQDEAKWERAKEAVDPEGDGADKYDEPYAVVAAVYKRMGGRIKGGRV